MSDRDIARYWPFYELPPAASAPLAAAALELELEDGEWLFHQGDVADALFVLIEGELDIYQGSPGQWRKRLEAGSCVGELPLVVGGQRVRTAAIRAAGHCRLLGVGYGDVRRLLSRRVFDSLLKPVTERHLAQLEFGLTSLFGKLPLELLVEIEGAMIQRRLRAGQVLFEQGSPLEHVWIVDDGRLEVLISRDGQLQRVAELGPGQPVGELAVLVGGERSATVRALRDSWLRGLSAATFEALLMRHPGAAVGLAKTLARRLMRANQQPVVVGGPRTLALLPGDAGVDVRAVAEGVVAQLNGSAAILDEASFVAAAPRASGLDGDPSNRRFASWLSGAEASHDVVMLILGPRVDAWARACIEAADEVVLVAQADGAAELGEVERAIHAGLLGGEVISLVLCRPPGTPAWDDEDAQLGPWLSARAKLVHVHHLALGDRRDYERLGRGLFRHTG